ncbi:MAG TPA: class I SAM-dependent methyltransferase [Gammaproteobacteria bacterium]|nr:class I SAM-dependent methyltransferase [Gammaproteobacteria bacterium]
MDRIPEPELMDDEAQARAYAEADFEDPHSMFVQLFGERFADLRVEGSVLDLGCGPADVTIRFARAYPDCRVHGVDGSQAMLKHGCAALEREGLKPRVRLIHAYLPSAALAGRGDDIVISNSLLHHLADPSVLWRAVKSAARPGAAVFVMDLMRPDSEAQVRALVQTYAEGEPEVLRRDFHNSLLAAYTPEEVRAQLAAAELNTLSVEAVTDRHLIVFGYLPA